ncbi:hypothetical protein GCM10027051_21930 [Niabella terrae]
MGKRINVVAAFWKGGAMLPVYLSSTGASANPDVRGVGDVKVNYPLAKDQCASCFTAICLLLRGVRSLTITPHVYAQVPYEVFTSYTDVTNILY